MSTAPAPVASVSATQQSLINKFWGWVKKEFVVVETDLAKILGADVTSNIESAGKALIESDFGPLIMSALVDATDVVTGNLSVSKAITSLVAEAEAAGKAISKAAALQMIGLAQNALPAQPATISPIA